MLPFLQNASFDVSLMDSNNHDVLWYAAYFGIYQVSPPKVSCVSQHSTIVATYQAHVKTCILEEWQYDPI